MGSQDGVGDGVLSYADGAPAGCQGAVLQGENSATRLQVWVATMEGYEEETRTTPIPLVSAPELGGSEQAYLASFRMLHLVVQVLGPLHDNVRPEHSPEAQNLVQQAWPREEMLEWPLLPSERWLHGEDDYVALIRSFRSGEILVEE